MKIKIKSLFPLLWLIPDPTPDDVPLEPTPERENPNIPEEDPGTHPPGPEILPERNPPIPEREPQEPDPEIDPNPERR